MEFQLDGLKTIGKVPFADDMKDDIMIFHAEPHMDYKTGEWYSWPST